MLLPFNLIVTVSEVLVTAISEVVDLLATVSEFVVTAIPVVIEIVASDSIFCAIPEVETGGNVVTIERGKYFTN